MLSNETYNALEKNAKQKYAAMLGKRARSKKTGFVGTVSNYTLSGQLWLANGNDYEMAWADDCEIIDEETIKRAEEVFFLDDGDEIISVEGKGDCVRVRIQNKDGFLLDYLPDMTDRPQAIAYIMGERDDFND